MAQMVLHRVPYGYIAATEKVRLVQPSRIVLHRVTSGFGRGGAGGFWGRRLGSV